MKLHLFVLVIACAVAGCGASGPAFKPDPPVLPAESETLAYIYRPKTLIGIINFDVPILHLDGQRLTRIRIGGYLRLPLKPGRHKLTTTESLFGKDTGKVRGETEFEITAGAPVYLRYTEKFEEFDPMTVGNIFVFLSKGIYRFEAVNESQARQELLETEQLELDAQSK